MTYDKPEIAILGDAASLIQLAWVKGVSCFIDPATLEVDFDPAYDLDE